MLAQVEAQKTQAGIVRENMKVQADIEDSMRQDRREREKMHLETLMKLAEMEAKYGTQGKVAGLEAQILREQEISKAEIQAETDRHNAMIKALSTPSAPQQGPMNA